jgi:NAD(P)-dependent dehydrogenase (short-subunit alcohol dehydrogenase family)
VAVTSQILNGKVAVITGGTRGLGLAIARKYAASGAGVVVTSRTQAAVEQVVTDLRQLGFQAGGKPCNVSDLSQLEELASYVLATFGRMDIWVNNAGVAAAHGPTLHAAPEEVTRVIQTNILGVYFGTLVALRHFLAKGDGKLINILGRGGRAPVPYSNAYASSKAWMRNFTLALAREYKDYGVGIFVFNPGLVDTDMLRNFRVIAGYEERARYLRMIIRLWANPPDVAAQKAVWLASEATDGRTGLNINLLGPAQMIRGVLFQGMRWLLRRPSPSLDLNVTSVPPAIVLPAQEETR